MLDADTTRTRHYNVLRLIFDVFYEGGTRPEGPIFTFSKRPAANQPLTVGWKLTHGTEIMGLLTDKYLKSEREGRNCGLFEGAREFFGNYDNAFMLMGLVEKYGLSSPETSFVIKEGNESKIFIPNFSISFAKGGILKKRETFEEFFNSDSYNLIRNLVQVIAANPDTSVPHTVQTQNLFNWIGRYGELARKRLRESMTFNPDLLYVEGISPDIVLRDLGHRPYEEIATEVRISKDLDHLLVVT